MKSLLLSIRELRARRYYANQIRRRSPIWYAAMVFDNGHQRVFDFKEAKKLALTATRAKFNLPNFTP